MWKILLAVIMCWVVLGIGLWLLAMTPESISDLYTRYLYLPIDSRGEVYLKTELDYFLYHKYNESDKLPNLKEIRFRVVMVYLFVLAVGVFTGHAIYLGWFSGFVLVYCFGYSLAFYKVLYRNKYSYLEELRILKRSKPKFRVRKSDLDHLDIYLSNRIIGKMRKDRGLMRMFKVLDALKMTKAHIFRRVMVVFGFLPLMLVTLYFFGDFSSVYPYLQGVKLADNTYLGVLAGLMIYSLMLGLVLWVYLMYRHYMACNDKIRAYSLFNKMLKSLGDHKQVMVNDGIKRNKDDEDIHKYVVDKELGIKVKDTEDK